jgi:hypothetical protein
MLLINVLTLSSILGVIEQNPLTNQLILSCPCMLPGDENYILLGVK